MSEKTIARKLQDKYEGRLPYQTALHLVRKAKGPASERKQKEPELAEKKFSELIFEEADKMVDPNKLWELEGDPE